MANGEISKNGIPPQIEPCSPLAIYWLEKDGTTVPIRAIVTEKKVVERPDQNGFPQGVVETYISDPMRTSRAIELPNARLHEGERGPEIILTEPLPVNGVEVPIEKL